MDVLELPRPVINFLRTMSKEMHRYSLCWDIYGGSESVTLTLTWKINCEKSNDESDDCVEMSKKTHQQQMKNLINSDIFTGASSSNENSNIENAKDKKFTSNNKITTNKCSKQLQHSKLENLNGGSKNCARLAQEPTINEINNHRNLSAESQSNNIKNTKETEGFYSNNSQFLNKMHQSRRVNTATSSTCQDCQKCANYSDTSIKLTKKVIASSNKKPSNINNTNTKTPRGKSLESHENVIDPKVFMNHQYFYRQDHSVAPACSIQDQDTKSTPKQNSMYQSRLVPSLNNNTIPISIITKDLVNEEYYNSMISPTNLNSCNKQSNPWIRRNNECFTSNKKSDNNNVQNERENGNLLNLIELNSSSSNISTFMKENNEKPLSTQSCQSSRNANLYTGSSLSSSNSGSSSLNNNITNKGSSNTIGNSTGTMSQISNNGHSKVTFDPKLEYI